MRISNNMLTRNFLLNLESSLSRIALLQNQMSSGKSITKPSDDPVGIQNALRFKSSVAMVEQWQSNASEALSYMNTADSVLGKLTSLLQRAEELGLQGANDTNSENERKAIVEEIEQIKEQIRSLANTKVGNKHIFSGTATDTAPIDGDYNFQGNTEAVLFDIGNNIQINVMVNGQELFFGPDENTDIFKNLDKLKTQLLNGDAAQISAAAKAVGQNVARVTAIRANLGARVNRLEAVQSQLESMYLNLKKNLSEIEDANMAKTITEFTNQQNLYQAALAVGSRILQPSLIDFMK
ncbi:MAG: flagellar hook-associated protein FlgL [Peptococcaceae bacterium]|nr:flagellar hook-associated protein FlgL [Peptococcaceae bacterium]